MIRQLPYEQALELQRELHARRVDDEIPDVCLLLEHQPVYTAGRRTSPEDRPVGDPGAPVVDTDRGGRITWHGPGQLVGYPIVRLDDPVDVVAYVRSIEEAMIRACAELGLPTARVDGRSGAWVLAEQTDGGPGQGLNLAPNVKITLNLGLHAEPQRAKDRKVAAIGIRVARGVTMHGFALNCSNDLGWFDRIVPCGIKRRRRDLTVSRAVGRARPPGHRRRRDRPVQRHLAAVLRRDPHPRGHQRHRPDLEPGPLSPAR